MPSIQQTVYDYFNTNISRVSNIDTPSAVLQWLAEQGYTQGSVSDRWRRYCLAQGIPYYGDIYSQNRIASGGAVINVSYLPTVTFAPLFIVASEKLRTEYTGPLQVVTAANSGDTPTTTQAINPNADGSPNVTAAMAEYGDIMQVVEWKDQSGNGNHATQSIAANRPILKNSKKFRGKQAVNLSNATTGATASRFLEIPTTLSTARTNLTVFVVYSSGGGLANGTAIMGLGTGTGSFDGFNLTVSNNASPSTDRYGGLGIVDSAFGGERGRQPSVGRLNVLSTQITATSRRAVVADNILNQTGQTITPADLTGGYIGKGPWSTANFGCGDIAAMLVYPALSDADVATITDFLATRYNTIRTANYSNQVIGVGDSIMAGTDSYQENFLYQVQESGTLSAPIYTRDFGIGGRTSAQCYTNRAHYGSAWVSGLSKNIYWLHVGTNDIYNLVSGSIAGGENSIYTNITNLVTYFKGLNASIRVVVNTVIPRFWPGTTTDRGERETVRLNLNTLIRDGAAANGYIVNDLAAVSGFGPTDAQGTPISTHYYADNTHLLASGYALYRDSSVTALNTALST